MNVTFNGWSSKFFLTKTLDGQSLMEVVPKEGSLCLFKGCRLGGG